MLYDNELHKENDWTLEGGVPCYIQFIRYKVINYKTQFFTKEYFYTLHTTQSKVFKKSAVLDYLHARLVLANPGYRVTRSGINRIPEVVIRNEKLLRITTCKRMVTQLTNKKQRYEDYQKTTLLPNWGNPQYKKIKNKLKDYKSELELLVK